MCFDARDLGIPKFFVGIKIDTDPATGAITLSQRRHIMDLASQYGITEPTRRNIPLSPGIRLVPEGEQLNTTSKPYAALVGSLNYLAVTSRPDISFAAGTLSRHTNCPTVEHWKQALNVLRYLHTTADHSITYSGPFELKGFTDSDHASCPYTRRSVSGMVFIAAGAAITWQSKLQSGVTLSTAEAEYVAACWAAREAAWLSNLMADFGLERKAIDMYCDNLCALGHIREPKMTKHSKHIDVSYHYVRERHVQGHIAFHFVFSQQNVADIFTKPLAQTLHQRMVHWLGMQ